MELIFLTVDDVIFIQSEILSSASGAVDRHRLVHLLRPYIAAIEELKQIQENYEVFDPADYIVNPVALARLQAGITQEELAKLMNVTQAYVIKIENQEKVTSKIMQEVTKAITKK